MALEDLLNSIPKQWAETQGWMLTYTNGSKRPLLSPKLSKNLPTLSGLKAPLDDRNIGFCTSLANDIVILDVDNIEGSPGILDMLAPLISRTYTEYSLSKNGLHIVFTTDKKELPNKGYIKTSSFQGQLSIKNNFMVTTGDKHPDAPTTLAHVSLQELSEVVELHHLSKDEGGDDTSEPVTLPEPAVDELPNLMRFTKMVMAIPIDQSKRVKTVYEEEFKEMYEHYHFWLIVGMAIYDYGTRINQLTQALEIYIKWSAQDQEAFVSDEDVQDKWRSFSSTCESPITYKTVIKLATIFTFQYPKRVYDSRNKKLTPYPITTEYDNFEYLLNKYHIKLCSMNNLMLFIKGDEDIISKYFALNQVSNLFGYYGPVNKAKLCAGALLMCQDSMWKGLSSARPLVEVWMEKPQEPVDVFTEWLDTPSDQLPPELRFPRYTTPRNISQPLTTIEQLEKCIEWDVDDAVEPQATEELYRKMLYATFMQLIKLHEPSSQQFEDNGGMFAMIGAENTYKTTFFKLLLPQPLEFMRKEQNQELTGDKNKRDFIRNLSTAAILLVDEFEGFMDHKRSGSFFKAVISSNTTSFTDIYQTEEQNLQRKAILVGTSNDYKQVVSDNGSRRLWYTRIKQIDTDTMLSLDLHAMYTNLRNRFRREVKQGKTPWLLTKDDTAMVTEHNKSMKTKSSLDFDLEEVFPYTTAYNVEERYLDREILIPFKKAIQALPGKDEDGAPVKGRFLKTQHVIKLLRFAGYNVPTTAELNRALTRFCMNFIGQRKRVINLHKDMVIEQGQLCFYKQGNRYAHRLWILPIEEDNKEVMDGSDIYEEGE